MLQTGPAKVTAAGDILYATGANALARLAKGTANQVLRMNAGETAPEWVSVPTTLTNYLGGDVSLASANTFYDGPSLSLPAGTWLLISQVHLFNNHGSNSANFTGKLWDASTVSSEACVGVHSQMVESLVVSGIVTPGGTTTYKLSCASTDTGGVVKAGAYSNSAGNYASFLLAGRLI